MGPNLIFDKSFLQSLNYDEAFELDMLFEPVCVPVLTSEIIADLRLKKPPKNRTAEDVVKIVASKMVAAHGGLEPVNARDLILAEIRGQEIGMSGSAPVRAKSSPDGRYVMYDSTPQQAMWARLAAGNFSVDDDEAAAAWRTGIDEIDLSALREDWQPFVSGVLGNPATIEALVAAVDAYISDPAPQVQLELLRMLVSGSIPRSERASADWLAAVLQDCELRRLLPYGISVLRLLLVYVSAVARGILGPRATDQIDLQYLFYAPFCSGFVSSDRLHETLWPAATTDARFVWGDDMKRDLGERADRRKTMTAEDWRQHHRQHGAHPAPRPNSPVNRIWEAMGPPRPYEPDDMPKSIDDFDPATRERFKTMLEEFRKLDG